MKNAITFFLLFLNIAIYAQEYKLKIIPSDSLSKKTIEQLSYNKKFTDTLNLKKEINNLLVSLYQQGYLAATSDSVIYDSTDVTAIINTGIKYKWGKISFMETEKNILRKKNLNLMSSIQKPVNYLKITEIYEEILEHYENNGYPFAEIFMENIEFKNDSIFGKINITKNNLYKIDSVYIKGDAKISLEYLYNYLSIEPGDIYNEKIIRNIKNRLNELVFIQEIRPYEVNFTKNKADIYLYLKNKKANRFNGIIGFLPNNQDDGKLLITGEMDLMLFNSFEKGEQISFNWQKLESQTQELNVAFNYPYFFSTPLGTDVKFNLYKKDTTYMTVNTNLGIQYFLQGGNYIKFYYQNKNSALISTQGFENLSVMPSYADITTSLYGIGYKEEHLDYKYNPRKGYTILFNSGIGTKNINKNSKIPDFLYNNIELNTKQFEGDILLAYYQKISKNTVLKLKSYSGIIYNFSSDNSSPLFENELYRIGGLKTIRGFDERTILSSSFSILTLEYRYLFEKNSCFYLFADGAYYEKNIINEFIADFPFGFGIGLDFQTKAGIFTINYAIGKQFDNPIEIRSAKIHFGYINRF